jgi:hypothetical protein
MTIRNVRRRDSHRCKIDCVVNETGEIQNFEREGCRFPAGNGSFDSPSSADYPWRW